MDAILVEELRKHYGAVQALDGVSFRVSAGEVFGLLGPNGAGKSTTVKLLATLTTPDGGRAEVAGHDVVRNADAVRHSIGYVPQSSGVDRDATGRENLMLQGRIQGMGGSGLQARVEELLGISGSRRRRPRRLLRRDEAPPRRRPGPRPPAAGALSRRADHRP